LNVLVTGAAGFIGRRLTAALLQGGELQVDGDRHSIGRLTLLDVAPGAAIQDSRVRPLTGEVDDRGLLEQAIDRDTGVIFHLAAVVSGAAEADFELGMRVNLDASRALLDVCRARGHAPRVVFTSSVAVFGGDLPSVVLDSTAVTPATSYGTQKAIVDLLINDYSRRGFVDGRALRLPTISVRPGRPNAALSSFASGIIREPLNGEPSVCPVAPETKMWLLSPKSVVACLIKAAEIPGTALVLNRSLNLPGLSIRVGEMVAALERVAGSEVAGRVRWEIDPHVAKVVATWPGELDAARARALGFPSDASFDQIIRDYMEERGAAG
jgi:nucleoside-diphosphate-sugar epimerase